MNDKVRTIEDVCCDYICVGYCETLNAPNLEKCRNIHLDTEGSLNAPNLETCENISLNWAVV